LHFSRERKFSYCTVGFYHHIACLHAVCAAKADIAFILDQSTSIQAATGGVTNWYDMIDFVVQVIDAFPISPTLTRIGLIRFSSQAVFDFGFSRFTNSPDVVGYVENMVAAGGETNFSGAYWLANQLLLPGRRSNVKCIVIMITDGQPNIDVETTFVNINITKEMGCEVFAVGITDKVCRCNAFTRLFPYTVRRMLYCI
jgi:von Willebrand factor type A domain